MIPQVASSPADMTSAPAGALVANEPRKSRTCAFTAVPADEPPAVTVTPAVPDLSNTTRALWWRVRVTLTAVGSEAVNTNAVPGTDAPSTSTAVAVTTAESPTKPVIDAG